MSSQEMLVFDNFNNRSPIALDSVPEVAEHIAATTVAAARSQGSGASLHEGLA